MAGGLRVGIAGGHAASRENANPIAALREYESLRRKRAEKFVTRSRALATMALVRGPVMVSARNTFMRVMGGTAYKRHSADMAYDVSTAA